MSEPIDRMYAPPAAEAVTLSTKEDGLGWAILAIPVAGGVIGPLLTLVSPDLGGLIGFPVIIATIVLIAKDAPRWGLKPSHQILGLVVLWFIYFPVYFHRRAKKGAPPRVALAIVSEFLYLGGFFALGLVQGVRSVTP